MKDKNEFVKTFYCCGCEGFGVIGSQKPIEQLSCDRCIDTGFKKHDDNRLVDLETGIILVGKGKGNIYENFQELKPKAKIFLKKIGLR